MDKHVDELDDGWGTTDLIFYEKTTREYHRNFVFHEYADQK